MKLYKSIGQRSVRAYDGDAAAMIFARRIARRVFGRRGDCAHVRLDSWAMDGSCGTYQAFIGTLCKGGGMTGHNVSICIFLGG